jgi:prolyl-tRNA synthetase
LLRLIGTKKPETEKEIKDKTKATVRCLPLDEQESLEGVCVFSGEKATKKFIFAKSY